MKKILFAILATSTFMFSCGDSGNTSEKQTIEPIEVLSENWEDVLYAHTDKANKVFEDLIDAQESEIEVDQLKEKANKVVSEMNDFIAEMNAHTIGGDNAKKLENEAENTKTKAIEFYKSIIDYSKVVEENASFLLKEDWSDTDDDKFEKEIIPIEDKVYFTMDNFDKASSDFYEALDAL